MEFVVGAGTRPGLGGGRVEIGGRVDPERRRRMGTAARARVSELFVNERVLGLTVALYKSLLMEPLGTDAAALAKAAAAVEG